MAAPFQIGEKVVIDFSILKNFYSEQYIEKCIAIHNTVGTIVDIFCISKESFQYSININGHIWRLIDIYLKKI